MVTNVKCRRGLAHEHHADRHPATEALGQGHDVGHHRRLLEGEEGAGAPDAGLDLVEDEERAH